MSWLARLLLTVAALSGAAGRPACCVADVFVSRGCCAEAVAIEQAREAESCSCCPHDPADERADERAGPRWTADGERAPADCACCARAEVVGTPRASHDAAGLSTPTLVADSGPVTLTAPAPAARPGASGGIPGRAPPRALSLPLLR